MKNDNCREKEMNFPEQIKEPSKIIGYFAHTRGGEVLCDGDACVIAGSEKLLVSYMNHMEKRGEKWVTKKTRFSEILSGLQRGAAYSIDEEAHHRFFYVANLNGITVPPTNDFFSVASLTGMHFMRIQFGGE
jgi:hypothetical protein